MIINVTYCNVFHETQSSIVMANVYGNASVDVSPHVHGANLWANRPWDEMSSDIAVYGRPWGKTSMGDSMGRNVIS